MKGICNKNNVFRTNYTKYLDSNKSIKAEISIKSF